MSGKQETFTWKNYLKHRIDRIKEGIIYMSAASEKNRPMSEEEFTNLMKLVEVINLERKMYMAKTTMILDLFDLVLNYNPTAPEVVQNQYKSNIQDKIKLVKQTLSLEKATKN